MVIFQTPSHFIKRWWNSNAHLIDFIDFGADSFAIKVRYHHSCWQELVSHLVLSDKDHIHLENVSLIKAKYLFFRHAQKVIFEEH